VRDKNEVVSSLPDDTPNMSEWKSSSILQNVTLWDFETDQEVFPIDARLDLTVRDWIDVLHAPLAYADRVLFASRVPLHPLGAGGGAVDSELPAIGSLSSCYWCRAAYA
jgi:hypothetical protein